MVAAARRPQRPHRLAVRARLRRPFSQKNVKTRSYPGVTEVAAAVIVKPDGSFLLGQRAPDTFYPGYWEFPGGKVEAGETPRAALVRELHEELEIEVLAATPWIMREHIYEHAHVRLHFFRVTAWRGELKDHVHSALSWQRADALDVAPMLPANAPVLAALRLPDFYAISQAAAIGVDAQLAALDTALSRGLRLLQLREPTLAPQQFAHFVQAAVDLCRSCGAQCLVNGDAALALHADGLHLPAAKLTALTQRPAFPLVAASCHTRAELEQAARLGIDFAVLGPVKPTATHPGRPGIGWEAFAQLAADLPLPVYALGGLCREDMAAAQAAGAQGVAAIRGAWTY
ncbi:MAG: Nudix family hydrolase [Rhodocyclales bacterium]|nr:Nudix family hydrolase [Rhodocyclales bacterium]